MGAFQQGWASGMGVAERQGDRRAQISDEQRHMQLENALAGATTQQERDAIIHDAYAQDPSKVKQFVENLGRRLAGKQPQQAPSPYVGPQGMPAPKTRQQAFTEFAAQGKTPEQQQQEAYQQQLKAQQDAQLAGVTGSYQKFQEMAKGLPPDQRATLESFFGVAPRPTLKEYASPDGQSKQWFDASRPDGIPPGWQAIGGASLKPTKGTLVKSAQSPTGFAQTWVDPMNPGKVVAWQPITPSRFYEGFTSTHQVPGMNAGEKINLTSTMNPMTQGDVDLSGVMALPAEEAQPSDSGTTAPAPRVMPPGRSPQNSAGAPVPAPQAGAPAPRLTAAPGASQGAPRTIGQPAPKRAPGAQPVGASTPPPAFAPGTMLSQGRNAEPVVASMNTVAAQVFGGNGEPPIWDSAWMFDNPQLRSALNKALTLNALAIPGTEDDPSFTQTLATALGVTGWSQDQIRQANEQARQNLQKLGGDPALQMFARMAGMQEDLSALRAATKGSAAQGSIRTLVRAAPVYNVASSQNFRDQLGVTLNTAASAMSGYPAINPAYVKWFQQGAQRARGKQGQAAQSQSGTSAIVQHSPSTGKYRYSVDGGKTWKPGQPPNQ
jgi:hypothetical protein